MSCASNAQLLTFAQIVGITAFGIQLTTALYEFGVNTAGAREQTEYIARHVSLYSDILDLLAARIQEDEPVHSSKALDLVRDVYDQSCYLFDKINDMLAGSNERMNFLEKLRWNFRKKKVELIVSEINFLKSTVSLLVSVLYAGKTVRRHRCKQKTDSMNPNVQIQRARIRNAIVEHVSATATKEKLEAQVEHEEEAALGQQVEGLVLVKSSPIKTSLETSSELVQYNQALESSRKCLDNRTLIMTTSVDLVGYLLDEWTTLDYGPDKPQNVSDRLGHQGAEAGQGDTRDIKPASDASAWRARENVCTISSEAASDFSSDENIDTQQMQAGESRIGTSEGVVQTLEKEMLERQTSIGASRKKRDEEPMSPSPSLNRRPEMGSTKGGDKNRRPPPTLAEAYENIKMFMIHSSLEFRIKPPEERRMRKTCIELQRWLAYCIDFQSDKWLYKEERLREYEYLKKGITVNVQDEIHKLEIIDSQGSQAKTALLIIASRLLRELDAFWSSPGRQFSSHRLSLEEWGWETLLTELPRDDLLISIHKQWQSDQEDLDGLISAQGRSSRSSSDISLLSRHTPVWKNNTIERIDTWIGEKSARVRLWGRRPTDSRSKSPARDSSPSEHGVRDTDSGFRTARDDIDVDANPLHRRRRRRPRKPGVLDSLRATLGGGFR